jgi:hypothetical protein
LGGVAKKANKGRPSPRPSPARGRGRKLKVYRTPIGFHDAYVAAPSQKAALEAWGVDVNLFARGSAEEVTEPELTREPLEKPGTVFKRLRGSAKEQMEAVERAPSRRSPSAGPSLSRKAAPARRKPKPSRAELNAAEEALEKLQTAHRREAAALERKEKALERERRELERKQEREIRAAEQEELRAREAYEQKLREWQGA